MEGWINEQMQNMRMQLSQGLLQSGYQGIGTALGPSQAVSGTAAQLANPASIQGNSAALSKLLGSQG
jgi:hypothetical protein